MTTRFLASILLVSLFISGCSDDELSSRKGDYYPTTPGSYWKYEAVRECRGGEDPEYCQSFFELWGGGDEHFSDKSFDPMSGRAGTFQFVKVVNHQYYMMGYYQPKFKFMDDKLSVNKSWITTADNDFVHEEFTVKEVNVTKNLRGTIFRDVIVIERNYLEKTWQGDVNPLSKTIVYYAKGIGQIYRDHTDYTSDNSFKEYLVEYKIVSE